MESRQLKRNGTTQESDKMTVFTQNSLFPLPHLKIFPLNLRVVSGERGGRFLQDITKME